MKNKNIHPTQQKLIKLLIDSIDDPLTIRGIQNILNISSTSVVAHHLNQLEKNGYIRRNPYNPRDYQILSASPKKKITYLNLYGAAHCGPNGSILDGNPIERIPIPTRLLNFSPSEAFMVKARGSSMKPKINRGDFVIVKKTKRANDGNIVVCVNDNEVLIKKIKKEKDRFILISLNHEYQPFLSSKDFRIEGEVKNIITNKIN